MKKKIFAILVLIILAPFLLNLVQMQIILLTIFGWFYYLTRQLPDIQINFQTIVLILFLSLAFFISFHQIANRNHRKWNIPHWKMKWSGTITILLLTIILSGFFTIKVVDHINLMSQISNKDFTQSTGLKYYKKSSINNLTHSGDAAVSYHHKYNSLPTFGSNPDGHIFPSSWETKLLPFLGEDKLYNEIDFSVPWNHTNNKDIFQTYLYFFKTVISPLPYQDENNYSLSHYSANALLLARSENFNLNNIKDGKSNTIIFGEVTDNLQPWGKPGNWRDPRIGLNSPKKGFHGLYLNGTHFTFGDGSVKHISNNIDPEVLKALGTPAGREEIPENY